MRNVPHLRLKTVIYALAVPYAVHDVKRPVHAINREELVFRATYEQHGLRTRKTGDMRIVQPRPGKQLAKPPFSVREYLNDICS